ncbi:MAG: hypothetical protein NZ789_17170, partial [Pseudomonadales bacterium]|nr:hypothetical protein [Pseudomonadales bacterium]
MTYENTDEDPATGNTRVVTITTMTDDGGTANSGDNDAALSLASTVTVAAADNDAPVNTVAAAAANEDVAVAISGTSIADVDDSSLDSVRITVTLGTFTLATSSATYDDGTQGTPDNDVTISGTIANINTALATITWTSASNDNTNAVFTILSDDGPNTDSDDFTVTVTAINDEPSIACTGGTPTFAEDGNAVSLFSSCTVLAGGAGGDAESDDIASMVFTVTNVADTTETINFDGSAIALAASQSGTTSGNSVDYSVSGCSSTCTVTITAGTGEMTTAELVTALDAMTYVNSDQSPTGSPRVLTITTLTDEGSSSSPNDNSATLTEASTVTVAKVNDAPTGSGSTTLTTMLEDGSGTGQTVSALFSSNFADSTDGDSLDGICITSYTSANGVLAYSQDNSNWVTVANVGAASAGSTIRAANYLKFTPTADYSGTSPTITVVVKDDSSAALGAAIGTNVDCSGGGGTSVYSSGTVTLTITITAVNDDPTLTVTTSTPTMTEDGNAVSLYTQAAAGYG